jgi:SAM-dependent methyltransferase
MSRKDERDPTYVLGRSEDEARRLEERAVFVNPPTRLLFEDAGITTGMKVLDVGSGPGDVTLLAAALVGPTGQVVGVDLNPAIVATARARAQAAGMTHVSFIAGDIREIELDGDFDAVVGRYVLMYSADPVATLRAALCRVRDNGVAAFYEANVASAVVSDPISPLHQSLGRWVSETFARSGAEMAMGTKLHPVFLAAGLEAPPMRTDALIGGGREWVERFVSAFGASLLRSLMPQILQYGVATEDEIAIETFDRRYLEEVLSQGSVIQWLPHVGAWARKRRTAKTYSEP